ncbi:MAG: aminoglycoside phosphotransferase family protein [Bacteroidetes bacterium]|nr:aminoglycoside phosphotransferase family protein [Bacteroidota bacterium]
MEDLLKQVLENFAFSSDHYTIEKTGTGLINYTYLVSSGNRKYILQEINTSVFKSPGIIDDNISAIGNYLHQHFPGYYFTMPIKALNGKTLVESGNQYFRLFEFVKDSKTFSIVNSTDIAYEAAKAFGRFTKLLKGFNANQLHQTIPHFHDLILRQEQFETAVDSATTERFERAQKLIEEISAYTWITTHFKQMIHDRGFRKRVTHHDTKISNVLFDPQNKSICVIDLDTIMPGYFFSDVGDMMRTYLSPAGEEEKDLSLVQIRDTYFEAIAEGYLIEMQEELSKEELDAFYFSGQFMIYMQALRFLTDFLNGDIYYTAKYPMHNFTRAANQLQLLKCYSAKKELYENKIRVLLTKKHYT